MAGIRETSLSLRYVFDAYDETPVLVLELWDEDMKARVAVGDVRRQLGADDHIGRCHVALQTLLDHTAHDRWYALEGPKDAAGEPRGGVGKVRVRLLFKPAGVMHCDGACTSEIALVGMVEADEYATGRKLERSPRSEFLGGGLDAKSTAAAEAVRSVAHERAALDARNEFWAGWATQRGFRNAKWRPVKFANVDWAIKPYLSGYEAHDPGRAAAELAAAKALKEGGGEGAVQSAIAGAMKAAEGLSTSLDAAATVAVDAALDAAQAGAVVAGSVVSMAAEAAVDAAIDASAVGGAAVLDLTDAAIEGLAARSPASQRMVRVK